MLRTLKSKGLVWPILATIAAFALLVSLGNWQMRRLAWKQGLVGAIAERVEAAPVPVSEVEWRQENGGDIEYTRVKATGQLLNDKELHLYALDERHGPGWQVVTPLRLADERVVFINRGYVPQDMKDPAKRAEGQLSGEVEIVGLARVPETPSTFTPNNDPAKDVWYWRDLGAMTKAAFGADAPGIVGFYIDAEAEPTPPGGWPKGGTTRLELPNRHLEYALTWYGLAAALLAVFAVFAVTRWRQPGPR